MSGSSADALVAKLLTAPKQSERMNDLADSDFVFNFLNATHTAQGDDGFIIVQSPSNYPALMVGGGAIGLGFIGPCGLNMPHVHPRANEIFLNIGGGDLLAQFVQENGVRVVNNTISPGMAILFPKGSIHFQQNLGCEPVTFVASFDFIDAGVSQVVTNLLKMNEEVLSATIGDLKPMILSQLTIPDNIALGAQSCLDKCGIDRSTFHFNSTFDEFVAASGSKPFAYSPANPSIVSRSVNQRDIYASAVLGDVSFQNNPLRYMVAGLSAAFLAMAVLNIYILVTRRRRSRSPITFQMSKDTVDAGYVPYA